MYAVELVQCCQLHKTPKIMLKLDFWKAFDSISWDSLDVVLEARGFGAVFRSWVCDILHTGKAAVLLNGVPGWSIECKNVLPIPAGVTHESIGLRFLHPPVDDMPCPVVQYANDTLILVRTIPSQVALLRATLDTFSAAMGLTINYHKSIFVPICVPAEDATSLVATLGCTVSSFLQTYLGLPLSDCKLPASALVFLVERISTQIPQWRIALSTPAAGSRTPPWC
jgi:hypothetical protein